MLAIVTEIILYLFVSFIVDFLCFDAPPKKRMLAATIATLMWLCNLGFFAPTIGLGIGFVLQMVHIGQPQFFFALVLTLVLIGSFIVLIPIGLELIVRLGMKIGNRIDTKPWSIGIDASTSVGRIKKFISSLTFLFGFVIFFHVIILVVTLVREL